MPKKKKPENGRKQLNRIEKKEDAEIKKLGKLSHEVDEIEKILKKKKHKPPLKKVKFKPAGGDMPTDFSIVAGTTGSFLATLTPPKGAQAPGTSPTWQATDTAVVLTVSGDNLECDAAVPADFAANSFDLKFSATSADTNIGVVSAVHTITVKQPEPGPLTSVEFAQTA